MFTTKVFEVLATKGMDVSKFSKRESLMHSGMEIENKIYGYRDEDGKRVVGQQEIVDRLFSDLKAIPMADKEKRDTLKVLISAEKLTLDNLYAELNNTHKEYQKVLGE